MGAKAFRKTSKRMKKFRVKVKRTHTTWINVEEKSYKRMQKRIKEKKHCKLDKGMWKKMCVMMFIAFIIQTSKAKQEKLKSFKK